jgi:hypothetical protein
MKIITCRNKEIAKQYGVNYTTDCEKINAVCCRPTVPLNGAVEIGTRMSSVVRVFPNSWLWCRSFAEPRNALHCTESPNSWFWTELISETVVGDIVRFMSQLWGGQKRDMTSQNMLITSTAVQHFYDLMGSSILPNWTQHGISWRIMISIYTAFSVKARPHYSCSCSSLCSRVMWTIWQVTRQAIRAARATGSWGSACCQYIKRVATEVVWTKIYEHK